MVPEPIVILANGDYPSHKAPLLILQDSGTIICCDGSANNLVRHGMEPHYILGDMDSIDNNLKNKYKERVIELSDQNENDLRKAIKWAERNGVKKAFILWATGKRDDHSLANIFTLLQFPTQMKCTILTNHGKFTVMEGTVEFNSFRGQQVSLFSVDPEIKITSHNLKYNFNITKLTTIYDGSLNESIDKLFTLTISHGKILVYQVFA